VCGMDELLRGYLRATSRHRPILPVRVPAGRTAHSGPAPTSPPTARSAPAPGRTSSPTASASAPQATTRCLSLLLGLPGRRHAPSAQRPRRPAGGPKAAAPGASRHAPCGWLRSSHAACADSLSRENSTEAAAPRPA
jgi:hypothetical protein